MEIYCCNAAEGARPRNTSTVCILPSTRTARRVQESAYSKRSTRCSQGASKRLLRSVFLLGCATACSAASALDPTCTHGDTVPLEETSTVLLQVQLQVGGREMQQDGRQRFVPNKSTATAAKLAVVGTAASRHTHLNDRLAAGAAAATNTATRLVETLQAEAAEERALEAAALELRSKQRRDGAHQQRSGFGRVWNGIEVAQRKALDVVDAVRQIFSRLLKKLTNTHGPTNQKTVVEAMVLLLLLGIIMNTTFWKSMMFTVPRSLEERPEELVRRIAVEHGLGAKAPLKQREDVAFVEPATYELGPSSSRCFRWLPLAVIFASILPPMFLHASGHIYYAMLSPAFWTVYCCHRWCLFMAVGCVVGLRKIRAYEKVDFHKMHREDMAVEDAVEPTTNNWLASRSPVNSPDPWDQIMHYVIVPNYKEDLEVLRSSIRSFAASPMAKEQIGVVLAMEEREEGARLKATTLTQEFRSCFKTIVTSFHPANLEGESAGKMSNERWAGQQLINSELPARGLKLENVLITVADADSTLHKSYFSALTYSHLRLANSKQGVEQGEHICAIWQAPMFAYKNIVRQPTVTRFSAWVTALHETSHLADPNAVALAYSTYSLSALMVAKVGGWDPDWVSEDFHMTVKCVLASGGKTKVRPIFLPIISTAPEGHTWWESVYERWVQAKRHALGFMELCYLADHLPHALESMRAAGRPLSEQLYCFWRSMLIFLTMTVLHLNLVLLVIIGPFTSIVLAAIMRSHLSLWPVYVFCAVAPLKMVIFAIMAAQDVSLFEVAKPHIDEAESSLSIWWKSGTLYAISQFVLFTIWSPIVVVPASVAEWLAAIKIFWTSDFSHEPASKGLPAAERRPEGGIEHAPESSSRM